MIIQMERMNTRWYFNSTFRNLRAISNKDAGDTHVLDYT